VPFEIVKPGTEIDFIGKRRLAAFLSLGLIVASLAAIPLRGIRLGIDFAGGTEILVKFAPGTAVNEGAIRQIVTTVGEIADPSVVRYGESADNEFLIRFRENINEGEEAGLAALRGAEEGFTGETEDPAADEASLTEDELAGETAADVPSDRIVLLEKALVGAIGPMEIQRVDFVGPKVGGELRADGLLAILWASLAILIYVAFRFSSRFAPGAIVAVIHDLLITAGIFVLLGLEFDLRILAAMLAILGYSLNDTIIIYDRIRENMEQHTTADLPKVLNLAVNQTLSRTILTSGTTLMALLSLFVLGGEVIRPFAFAMIIGVFVGTYSSIFIAAPVLLLLEGRYGDKPSGSPKAAGKAKSGKAKSGKAKSGKAKPARA